MQCNCGGETRNQSHTVKSLKKGREWSKAVNYSDLPIKVDRDQCGACGRYKARIYSASGRLIDRRG